MNKNNYLIQLSESDKTQLGKVDFAAQSTPQKVFSTVWNVESEVNNGGFRQYFENDCETASFAAEAFEQIGAPKTAAICRRAVEAAFPDGVPDSPDDVSGRAAELSPEILSQLDDLDSEFFTYPIR